MGKCVLVRHMETKSYFHTRVLVARNHWMKMLLVSFEKHHSYLSGCLCKHKKLSLFILQQTRILYKFMLRWIDLIASQNSASFHKNNFLGFSFDIKNMTLHPMSAINFMKMVKQVDHIWSIPINVIRSKLLTFIDSASITYQNKHVYSKDCWNCILMECSEFQTMELLLLNRVCWLSTYGKP